MDEMTPQKRPTTSDEQREIIHANLIEIRAHLDKQDRAIGEFSDKFQALARYMIGKPINGEPIGNDGGWCGRMGIRMDTAEHDIDSGKDKMEEFEKRTPTKRGLMVLFGACTAALGIIQAIAVLLVWAHK